MTHTIKVTFTNNDHVTTRINGEEKEIYNYYRNNNRLAWVIGSNNLQVKKIEFLESELLKNKSSLKYLFIENKGLYQ